eukprot:TRINITY_DN4656_c0_g1_i2.p1 TRINITY_DN4656_c0_g1~~TRINITY_DN4656_c0_g1_i2.p1  ORF type:complete len:154 (-),score=31.78 TRINITY_DN4656_c0_g1_i2:88-549(-)
MEPRPEPKNPLLPEQNGSVVRILYEITLLSVILPSPHPVMVSWYNKQSNGKTKLVKPGVKDNTVLFKNEIITWQSQVTTEKIVLDPNNLEFKLVQEKEMASNGQQTMLNGSIVIDLHRWVDLTGETTQVIKEMPFQGCSVGVDIPPPLLKVRT